LTPTTTTTTDNVDALVGGSCCDFNEDLPSFNDGVPAKAIADAAIDVSATLALTSLCQLLPGLLIIVFQPNNKDDQTTRMIKK
jgi:hypothetical protein